MAAASTVLRTTYYSVSAIAPKPAWNGSKTALAVETKWKEDERGTEIGRLPIG
jgi:hypothetical protein